MAARCASTEASTALRIRAISPGLFTARMRATIRRRSASEAWGAKVANFLHRLRLKAIFSALGLRCELRVNLGKALQRFLKVGGEL